MAGEASCGDPITQCMYADKCTDLGEKCSTCVNSPKRSYYQWNPRQPCFADEPPWAITYGDTASSDVSNNTSGD